MAQAIVQYLFFAKLLGVEVGCPTVVQQPSCLWFNAFARGCLRSLLAFGLLLVFNSYHLRRTDHTLDLDDVQHGHVLHLTAGCCWLQAPAGPTTRLGSRTASACQWSRRDRWTPDPLFPNQASQAKFVFVGAGGWALLMLQKAGIPEAGPKCKGWAQHGAKG